MLHNCCKDYCVPLVGLHCSSYYSTCRISRQYGKCQGALHDEGVFHTEVFTNIILGRISEAWPCLRVTKGIVPSQYIYPIARYKKWLEDDMKWSLRDEKAYMKTTKKVRRTEWPPWYALYFTSLHFLILMFLFLNLIKDWNIPNSLRKQSYHLLIWAIKESLFFIFKSLLIVISFIFSFSFLFPLPCNFFPWLPFGNFRHAYGLSPNFCLDCLFGFSI